VPVLDAGVEANTVAPAAELGVERVGIAERRRQLLAQIRFTPRG
jgi:hypothetical protein